MSAANHYVEREPGAGFGRPALRPALVPAVEPALGQLRSDGAASIAFRVGFRTLFIWFASLVAVAGGALTPATVGLALLCTVVWSFALNRAYAAARIKRVAVGPGFATGIGIAAGLAGLSALALWVPWLGLVPLRLVEAAGLVLLAVAAWEGFVERSRPEQRRILLVGGGAGGAGLLRMLADSPRPGFEIVGIVDDDCGRGTIGGVPVRGRVADLPAIVQRDRPDLVVVAVDRNRHEVFAGLLEVAEAGFSVVGLPELYEQAFGQLPVRQLTAAWFMSVLHLYQRPYSRLLKRTFDVAVAAAALFVLAPLFPLIALLVRRTPGPAIFRQTRLGEGGRHFTILKFRTMREDAEADGAPAWAAEDDPRATAVGRLLRRTRLDELPQLWNVLRGDMSIVGPRPERPEYLELLSDAVPFWTSRHLLRPGITGWAQVTGGYAADCESTETKLSYDLWYLRHRSLAIDLVVCAKTFTKLVSGSGAR
jgi:exopolysaccharide biosynthesis polyprenyl glycosylphosphotransferase